MKKLILVLTIILASGALYAQVSMEQNGDIVTLKNEKISASFNTRNADVTAITNKGKSLLGNKGRAYLLGPGFSMSPSKFTVVRNTKDLVELSFYTEQKNHFQYDLHYVLRSGDAGLYCFLVQSHKVGDSAGVYGQTRWGVRADEKLFDYHLVRDSIQGPMPPMDDLKDGVQDWTYRLADSSYYTK